MAQPKRIRLGDLLLEHKLISEAQLEDALAAQKKTGRKLGRVLIENGYVKEDELLGLLSRQLGVPYVDLSNYPYKPKVVKLIPETCARRYRALALEETPDGLLVGMADPTNIFAYDDLVRILKRPVKLAVVKESDLLNGIEQVYQHGAEIQHLASEIDEDLAENVFDLNALNQSVSSSDAPVVRLIETVFEDAVRAKASDIHIEPDEKVLRIRRRIDGVLQEQVMNEKAIAPALVSRLKLMAGLDIAERRLPQDGRFNIKLKDKSVDVRFATMPTQYGEAVVMRLLDHSEGVKGLDEIGLSASIRAQLEKAIRRPHGLLLVTGPTGSGKTTTLYAALQALNEATRKIITVEDPVEYRLSRVSQVQVNPKIGLDFARVLRTTLRQDPDVILVGEIRDHETAEIALRAAITGHLVMSTLHTNDAISTVMRLVDMGVEDFLIASAVHAILAQRLVRRICDKCRTDDTPDAGQLAWLAGAVGEEAAAAMRFQRGAGCPACHRTGYRGRVPIHEMLELDEGLADALRQHDHVGFKRKALAQEGYRPLVQSGLALAAEGVTTLEEVIRVGGWVE